MLHFQRDDGVGLSILYGGVNARLESLLDGKAFLWRSKGSTKNDTTYM